MSLLTELYFYSGYGYNDVAPTALKAQLWKKFSG
jgi:hypothetical protein